MHKRLKIVLALLLFSCLFWLPYWYYIGARFLAMAAFLFLAYESHKNEDNNDRWIYFFMAVLFQPFIKLNFGASAHYIWNFIDALVGLALLINVLVKVRR